MSDETRRFFHNLFVRAPENSKANIFLLPQARSHHLAPDPDLLCAKAHELDAAATGVEGVYFVVCPLRDGLSRHQKGGASDVVQVAALWADIDFAHPTHASSKLPPDLLSAYSLIPDAGLPDPSMLVSSGAGLQPYWLLEETLSPEWGRTLASALHKRIQEAADRRGWHLDNVVNLDRVLRVPGTHNRKDPSNIRPCTLLELTNRRFPIAQLVPSAEAASASAPPGPKTSRPASPPHGDAASVEGTIHPDDVLRLTTEALKRLTGERSTALAATLLHGCALPKGSRDTELNRLAGLVAALAPKGASPDVAVRLLFPVVDATIAQEDDPKNPAPTREDALDKLTRSMADLARKRARSEGDAASLQKSLIRAARASAKTDKTENFDDEDRPYTKEELQRFEAEHGSPLQWIVQHQGAHYILVGGQYQGPTVTSDVGVRFKEALAPAPIDRIVYEGNKARDMRPQEILEKYSTVAEKVVADLRITHGRWSPSEKTFYEACAKRRQITPRYNAEIQRWLELLGGRHAEQLLDWIASVTRLDLQCSALYLSKTKGTGKSVLAAGLARIWGSAPTDLSCVTGNFNADIARCPLIVADEHLPTAWTDKKGSASGELRKLVGSDVRTLSRKFLPNIELLGALRIMLLANDKTMLPFDESLGLADIEAIGDRFLHISTTPAAAEYLQSLGGKTGRMSGWVDGDQIAAHALWLKDNRKVEGKGRFVVQGDTNDVRLRLITGTKIGGLVCEVIVRTLMAPPKGPQAVRAGGGRLLVSTSGISEQWEFCVKSDRVESTQRIGRQLSAMSEGSVKVGGHPHHSVRPEYIYYWIEQNLVGDVDKIKALIENNPPTLELVG